MSFFFRYLRDGYEGSKKVLLRGKITGLVPSLIVVELRNQNWWSH